MLKVAEIPVVSGVQTLPPPAESRIVRGIQDEPFFLEEPVPVFLPGGQRLGRFACTQCPGRVFRGWNAAGAGEFMGYPRALILVMALILGH